MRASRKRPVFVALVGISLLSLVFLGFGCGDGDNGVSISIESEGWVTIDYPTTEPALTANCNSINLGGWAFISSTWSSCCEGTTEEITGVTVTWENLNTGATGKADQSVDICWIIIGFDLCDHRWIAEVPLVLGDNLITVTASDPSGRIGQDSITVTYPVSTYSVSGRAYGLSGVKMDITGPASQSTTTDANGYYTFSCLENGSYTITPFDPCYTFTPESREVTVNDADVIGQDFTATLAVTYSISGRVTDGYGAGGVGKTVYLFDLTGPTSQSTTTGAGGYYAFSCVQNGSYIIRPSDIWCYFTPESREVTVNDADVIGQDFFMGGGLCL